MIRTLLSVCLLLASAAPVFAQGATMSPPAPYAAEGMPQSANSVPSGARTLNSQRNSNGKGVIYQYNTGAGQAVGQSNAKLPDAPAARTVPTPASR